MESYRKHIIDVRTTNETNIKTTYCGKQRLMEFCFQDVTHAVATIQSGSALLPCKKCRDIVVGILVNEEL